MKKFVNRSSNIMLTLVGTFAFMVGTVISNSTTWWWIQQPKCPNHLLK